MSTGITRSTASTPAVIDENMPDYLKTIVQAGGETGTELLSQYIKPPRVKIVQPQSGAEYQQKFNVGDVIITPHNVLLAEVLKNEFGKPSQDAKCAGNIFAFTPLFFYPEFCVWNPYDVKGQDGVQMIRERSLDPKSDIAKRCRNFDRNTAPYPEPKNEKESKLEIRFIEHMNFVIALPGHETFDTPSIQSFSRSSFKAGVALSQDIRMRGPTVPIWAGQYQSHVRYCVNDQSQWYGMVSGNPAPGTGISMYVEDSQLAEYYRAQHEYFKGIWQDGILQADYEEPELAGAASNVVDAAAPDARY